MNAPRFSGNPDIMWNWNNGVVFVVPLPGGRLAELSSEVMAGGGLLKGWLWSDHEEHCEVRLGTATEGQAFVEEYVAAGLIVAHADNLNVPFSSGPRRHGEHAGQYSPNEYWRLQFNTPPREYVLALSKK